MVQNRKTSRRSLGTSYFSDETWLVLWGDAFKRAIDTHINLGYTELMGIVHPEYVSPSRAHVLCEIRVQIVMQVGDIGLMSISELW